MRKLLFLLLVLLLANSSSAADAEGVKVDVLTKSTTSWDGQSLEPLAPGQPEVTILRIVIPPKTKLPMHTHPTINAGVLLKGELTVETENDQILHLKAGDPIVEVVNTFHYGINDGNQPAEIIVFYVGPEGEAITIKK